MVDIMDKILNELGVCHDVVRIIGEYNLPPKESFRNQYEKVIDVIDLIYNVGLTLDQEDINRFGSRRFFRKCKKNTGLNSCLIKFLLKQHVRIQWGYGCLIL